MTESETELSEVEWLDAVETFLSAGIGVDQAVITRLFDLALRGAATQWRPIEPAPTDGTFLAWNGHWRGVAQYFAPAYIDDPCWVDETTAFIEPQPTHWMPLPPPPALGEPNE